jgi:hypothetical protein
MWEAVIAHRPALSIDDAGGVQPMPHILGRGRASDASIELPGHGLAILTGGAGQTTHDHLDRGGCSA